MAAHTLREEDVWLFQHNGFVQVHDAVDAGTLDRLAAVIDDHAARRVEPIVVEKGPTERDAAPVRRLSKIIERDPAFREVAASPAVTEPLAALLGPDIELCTNRHNHVMIKPPGAEPVYWHRDAVIWSRPIVTVLLYVDDATIENGCLEVVPGSHQSPWPIHNRLHQDADQERVQHLLKQAVPVPMRRGSLLITHGCLLHGSGPNRSSGPRRSLTLAYHAADEIGEPQPSEKILVRGERRLQWN